MQAQKTKKVPRPLQCDVCGAPNVQLVSNEILYGKPQGVWPLIYYCASCMSAVSCHPGTDKPMGFMADHNTRQMRRQAHKCFDKLWKTGLVTRSQAYSELGQHMLLNADRCHISMFDSEQCASVVAFCKQRLHELQLAQRGHVYKQGKKISRRY